MKKLIPLMVAVVMAFGSVAVTFAQDTPKKDDSKGKKKKKKKTDSSTTPPSK